MKKKIKISEIIIIFITMFMVTGGIHFIMNPGKIVLGGVSGLVLVLSNFVPLSISMMTFIINAALLLLGYFLVGKEFGGKTALATLLIPFYLRVFETFFPNPEPLTGDTLIDAISYLLVLSFGQAILFRINASTGGMDVIAKLMNKYLYMDIGRCLMIAGFVISATSVFAYDRKSVVVSLICTYFSGQLLDSLIGGFNMRKKVCIISKEYEEIYRYIHEDLNRTATFYTAIGGKSRNETTELVAILQRNEYGKLIEYIRELDTSAFVTVYNVADLFGFWNDNRRRKQKRAAGKTETTR